MPYHNHNDVPTITMLIVFIIAIAGAILNFAKRKLRNITWMERCVLFVVDVISSSTLAVISFYGVLGLGYNELVAIAVAGAFSHQGTRAVYLLELIIAEKTGAKTTLSELIKDKKEDKSNV